MAISPSKAALAEAAALLGRDKKSARTYLRIVQQLSGPPTVGYVTIVDMLRDAGQAGRQASRIAARIREMRSETWPDAGEERAGGDEPATGEGDG